MINRADLLGEAVAEENEVLCKTPISQADGWGVGFYQGGEVLHKKRPKTLDAPIDWSEVTDGIRSHIAIAQVRKATSGDQRAANTHPFRMRQWLFAHVGEINGYDAIRTRLTDSLPDFLQRNVRGETDSEQLCHLILSFLHDAGQLDAPEATDQAVVGALRSSVKLVDAFASEVGAPPGTLNLLLTNGRQLYALRRGRPMAIIVRDRLPKRQAEGRGATDVRYTLIATTEDDSVPPGYKPIEEGQVVAISRDLEVTSHAL